MHRIAKITINKLIKMLNELDITDEQYEKMYNLTSKLKEFINESEQRYTEDIKTIFELSTMICKLEEVKHV